MNAKLHLSCHDEPVITHKITVSVNFLVEIHQRVYLDIYVCVCAYIYLYVYEGETLPLKLLYLCWQN